jgi:RNA polymerase sigma-70 factor, ECF subfamily
LCKAAGNIGGTNSNRLTRFHVVASLHRRGGSMTDAVNQHRQPAEITRLLERWSSGDKAALECLLPLVHGELERIAAGHLRRENRDHTLQVGGLVNEAFVRLIGQQRVQWANRSHFFAIASQLMRRILVDYARQHRAAKRGGGAEHLTVSGMPAADSAPDIDVLWLHEALGDLQRLSPRQAMVVELRYFGGLSVEEAAEALDLSPATVKRDWSAARTWLVYRLKPTPARR